MLELTALLSLKFSFSEEFEVISKHLKLLIITLIVSGEAIQLTKLIRLTT